MTPSFAETPLAQLWTLINECPEDRASADWQAEAIGILTDLEAAPPHEKHEEVVTRVATGETMPATGSTAKTANGLSGSLFRKRPVVVEATLFDGTWESVAHVTGINGRWFGETLSGRPACFEIATLEGVMTAMAGDWIIRGVKGEFYPCKPDIFAATYETVAGEAAASRPAEPAPQKADPQ